MSAWDFEEGGKKEWLRIRKNDNSVGGVVLLTGEVGGSFRKKLSSGRFLPRCPRGIPN